MGEIGVEDRKCLGWGASVLAQEQIEGWEIVWDASTHEGIVLFKSKTIRIGWPKGEPDHALLLHEIAHVKVGCGGHDSVFAHVYMEMVRRYFLPLKGEAK